MDGRDKPGHDGLNCVMTVSTSAAGDTLPLAGIRVLEFCHAIMGPSAGLILADLGADVIKVEPVDGDLLAGWSVSPRVSSALSTATSAASRSI